MLSTGDNEDKLVVTTQRLTVKAAVVGGGGPPAPATVSESGATRRPDAGERASCPISGSVEASLL